MYIQGYIVYTYGYIEPRVEERQPLRAREYLTFSELGPTQKTESWLVILHQMDQMDPYSSRALPDPDSSAIMAATVLRKNIGAPTSVVSSARFLATPPTSTVLPKKLLFCHHPFGPSELIFAFPPQAVWLLLVGAEK